MDMEVKAECVDYCIDLQPSCLEFMILNDTNIKH